MRHKDQASANSSLSSTRCRCLGVKGILRQLVERFSITTALLQILLQGPETSESRQALFLLLCTYLHGCALLPRPRARKGQKASKVSFPAERTRTKELKHAWNKLVLERRYSVIQGADTGASCVEKPSDSLTTCLDRHGPVVSHQAPRRHSALSVSCC